MHETTPNQPSNQQPDPCTMSAFMAVVKNRVDEDQARVNRQESERKAREESDFEYPEDGNPLDTVA